MTTAIELCGVTKVFEAPAVVLDELTLEAGSGEFLVLVGPSGCGKSTLLRLIAGLDEPTAGVIRVGGVAVNGVPPRDRDLAMVFQSYALYPHMTVAENMSFGLRLRRRPKDEIRERVLEAAAILGLEEMLERRPATLSGGQRQRVAIGRALVRRPKAFLMDEPLSNLDAQLRVTMRSELRGLHQRLGITTLYVTHDQVEAMTLGDRVAVLRDGVLQQVGTPIELFRSPANLFVAGFIGSPPMNLLRRQVVDSRVDVAGRRLTVPALACGSHVLVGIRPSAFEDAEVAPRDGRPTLDVVADVVEQLGDETHVLFELEDAGGERERVLAVVDARSSAVVGARLTLTYDAESVFFFDERSGDAL
jgi:multiple sugar transport system ATP-binding protein